jgi:hypothetical protein
MLEVDPSSCPCLTVTNPEAAGPFPIFSFNHHAAKKIRRM